MDRVLTDEDFKMIRKLKRKQEEEKEWDKMEILEEKNEGVDADNSDDWEEVSGEGAD